MSRDNYVEYTGKLRIMARSKEDGSTHCVKDGIEDPEYADFLVHKYSQEDYLTEYWTERERDHLAEVQQMIDDDVYDLY